MRPLEEVSVQPLALTLLVVAVAACASARQPPASPSTGASAAQHADTFRLRASQSDLPLAIRLEAAGSGVALLTDAGGVSTPVAGVLRATTPARLVVPDGHVRIVLVSLDSGRVVRLVGTALGPDGEERAVDALGMQVALERSAGGMLRFHADEIFMRRDP
jgi:hypothetical protein